jgi:type I restriction enzyme R subunit
VAHQLFGLIRVHRVVAWSLLGIVVPRPEERARENIDRMLSASGWDVQNYRELDLGKALGVAVREFPVESGHADYLLFIDRKAVGVVEAKPEGTTLSGVAEQSEGYLLGIPSRIPRVSDPPPFHYESTGTETQFRDLRDPDSRSRRVFFFHRPETILEWIGQGSTLRARLRSMPVLQVGRLWPCQIDAVENLEQSLAHGRPRALVQMATGSGKTFTTVSLIYRLVKFAKAKRVLFLVDRRTLGVQARKEFEQYETPDDGRKFTALYNVQHMTSNTIDGVSKVCIATIQRVYSMLSGSELEPDIEESSMFELDENGIPRTVAYNPSIPIETFDFIVADECHRSIYQLWRQVLEYFDCFIIGLTATPSKQTIGFFDRNLVMEYGHDRAVADGVNVGYDVYRIRTEITEHGSKIDAGNYVDVREKQSRRITQQLVDASLAYEPSELDRSVVAKDQIRTIIKTFRERLPTEIFPGRKDVPKTLVFSKDDSHAEDIVHIIREEFGRGNDFCKKITYKTTGEKPEDLIASFRNSYNPRIAVTVDMISTGTDIKPLECLLFMRDVHSPVYFDQMKGRGTRTISDNDLQRVTPDASHKTHFMIVDAVGVCESDKTDMRPLEKRNSVPFRRLLQDVALGVRDEATLSSLANRLARFNREIDEKAAAEIREVSDGVTLEAMVNRLLEAIDPDRIEDKAIQMFAAVSPNTGQLEQARQELVRTACSLFDRAVVRNKILEIKKRSEQVIDTISQDSVLFVGTDAMAKAKAKTVIDTFKKFIEDNKDNLVALQMIYSKPYGRRHLTYKEISELADALRKDPYYLSTEYVWSAYEKLDKSRVAGAGPEKLLTNVVSLVRHAIGQTETLEPFYVEVDERFENWVAEQEKSGRRFTAEQMEWLEMIKSHIATSLSMETDDFERVPFNQKGGIIKAGRVFGNDLDNIVKELNEVLVL